MKQTVQAYLANQERLNKRRRILRPMMRALGAFVFEVDVTGLENIPKTGASILMINHISIIDPAVLTALVKDRFVISMAKIETLDEWFARTMLRLWGNFTIRRGEVDRRALNSAVELLKHEHLLLIAPEGTRTPEGLREAKNGLAYIAYKTDAIIVPTAVCGAQDWSQRLKSFRRAYVNVSFGKPFRLKLAPNQALTRPIRKAMMREAMYQLALTIPEAYAWQRGFYHDVENATSTYLEFV